MWGLFEDLRTARRESRVTTFHLAESEVNAYLRDLLASKPRPGLKRLSVKLFPSEYVSTYSVVNFEDIEKWRPGTVPAVMKPLLQGDQAIWIDLRFHAASGLGTFSIEKAYWGNLKLPAILVDKVIQILAARQPEHFDTTKPVPLPFGLKQVSTSAQSISGRT
jgi:hypothetical protein